MERQLFEEAEAVQVLTEEVTTFPLEE